MIQQSPEDHADKNPVRDFLISGFATALRAFLSPAYFVFRSHMGIMQSAFSRVMELVVIEGLLCCVMALTSEVNRRVIGLFTFLTLAGYVRNALQARERRRVRDWSVKVWSTGSSLCEPVTLFVCRRLYRKWGGDPSVERLLRIAVTPGFIYYFAEPFLMVLVAVGLWSIKSTLWFFPLLVAAGLITARNEDQLALYLKAHKIMDGKILEAEIKAEIQGPSKVVRGEVRVAQIPPAPTNRPATDAQSVFDRLSPELQTLLMRDRAARN